MRVRLQFFAGNPPPGLYVFDASDSSFIESNSNLTSEKLFLNDIASCSPTQTNIVSTVFGIPPERAETIIAETDGIRSVALIVRFTDGGKALAVADSKTYEVLRGALRALYTARALNAVIIDRRGSALLPGQPAFEPATEAEAESSFFPSAPLVPAESDPPSTLPGSAEPDALSAAGSAGTGPVSVSPGHSAKSPVHFASHEKRAFLPDSRLLRLGGLILVVICIVVSWGYIAKNNPQPIRNWYGRIYNALEKNPELAQRYGSPRALIREDRLGRLAVTLEYPEGPISLPESRRLSYAAARITGHVLQLTETNAPRFSTVSVEVCYQDKTFGNDCVNPHGKSIFVPETDEMEWQSHLPGAMAMQHLDVLRRAEADAAKGDEEALKSFIELTDNFIESYPEALDQLAVAHAMLSKAYTQLRSFKVARYNARLSIALDPEDPVGYEAVAMLMEAMHYYDRALEYVEHALERSPHDTLRESLMRSAARLRTLIEPVTVETLVDGFMEDLEAFALHYGNKRITVSGEITLRQIGSREEPLAVFVPRSGPVLVCIPPARMHYETENIDKNHAIAVGSVGVANNGHIELLDCEIIRTW